MKIESDPAFYDKILVTFTCYRNNEMFSSCENNFLAGGKHSSPYLLNGLLHIYIIDSNATQYHTY